MRPRSQSAGNKSAKHVKDRQFFSARTLSLVPSRSLAQWKTLLRKFFPKHADGTLTRSM
jgi:hypothetical protein